MPRRPWEPNESQMPREWREQQLGLDIRHDARLEREQQEPLEPQEPLGPGIRLEVELEWKQQEQLEPQEPLEQLGFEFGLEPS